MAKKFNPKRRIRRAIRCTYAPNDKRREYIDLPFNTLLRLGDIYHVIASAEDFWTDDYGAHDFTVIRLEEFPNGEYFNACHFSETE